MKAKLPFEPQIVSALISPEDSELMIEPKRSCNHCYGRGSALYLEGDGYQTVAADGYSKRVPNPKRIQRPCHCVFRNARFRIKK